MKSKNGQKKSIILRFFILFVCGYFIVSLAGLWNSLNERKNELAQFLQEKASKENDIEELKALLEGDPNKIIERAARERLGYIYSDEQVFKDISGN